MAVRHRDLLLALTLALWALAPPAAAEDVETQLGALASPAQPDVVRQLVHDDGFVACGPALELVRALRASGGHAAADGLRCLVERRDRTVRIAALEALGHVGLRTPKIRQTVRMVLERGTDGERIAAMRAVAQVGDARDMTDLLDALASKDGRVRSAAFRAICALSRQRLPASPRRVARWWAQAQPRETQWLHDAIRRMPETLAAGEDAASLRETIARYGWLDIETVEAAADSWVRSWDLPLKTEGLHVVRVLGLAHLEKRVRYELRAPPTDERRLEAAREAARALGICSDAARSARPSEPGAGVHAVSAADAR